MARFDDHGWSDIRFQGILPACGTNAPLVAWLQSGKPELGSGCDEVIALGH